MDATSQKLCPAVSSSTGRLVSNANCRTFPKPMKLPMESSLMGFLASVEALMGWELVTNATD